MVEDDRKLSKEMVKRRKDFQEHQKIITAFDCLPGHTAIVQRVRPAAG